MKILWLLLAALLAGTLLGFGTSMATFRTAHGRLTEADFFGRAPDPISPAKGASLSGSDPRITVDSEEYDFGVLENGEPGEHPFVVANDGGSTLEIEMLEVSCKCTSADLAQGRKVQIEPGKTFEVKLSWHANSSSGVFRQAAKLATNDPRRPQIHLVVVGKVVKGVEVIPPFFHLVGLSVGQPAERELQIHSYRSKDFQVLSHELTDGLTPDLFELTFEPATVDATRYPGVLSAVTAKLKVKPGLPIGNVSQRFVIRTNDPRKPELTLVAAGVLDGPVSISGLHWIPQSSLLKIGAISRQEGFKTTLLMKVIGVDPKMLNPKIMKVEPPNIELKFGEPRVVDSEGRVVVTYSLSVNIPSGGPVLTYLDTLQSPLGVIEIDTGHAETGVLRMNVELVTVD